MRDLARQNFSADRQGRGILIRLILLALITIGIIVVAKQFLSAGGAGNSSIILSEAPHGLVPIAVDNLDSIVDKGVDLVTQSASFVDVKYGGSARATAKRSFGGGTYILSVEASLPDPKNTFYQVWLVGGGKVVPIDFMRGSKNSWSLNMRSTDSYSQYDGIWITLERTKDDLPEEHVLEGSF